MAVGRKSPELFFPHQSPGRYPARKAFCQADHVGIQSCKAACKRRAYFRRPLCISSDTSRAECFLHAAILFPVSKEGQRHLLSLYRFYKDSCRIVVDIVSERSSMEKCSAFSHQRHKRFLYLGLKVIERAPQVRPWNPLRMRVSDCVLSQCENKLERGFDRFRTAAAQEDPALSKHKTMSIRQLFTDW